MKKINGQKEMTGGVMLRAEVAGKIREEGISDRGEDAVSGKSQVKEECRSGTQGEKWGDIPPNLLERIDSF